MTPAPEPFAARLRRLLERSGLTAYALAGKAGVSKQTVSKLLRGEQQPSWETVQRLAAALGVSTEAMRTDRQGEP